MISKVILKKRACLSRIIVFLLFVGIHLQLSNSWAKLSTPVIFKPANNSIDIPTGVQLEVKSESVTKYAFEYSLDAGMKNATRVEEVRGSYYTRIWLTKLKINTRYYWRVKSISKTDSSDWTSINNFKTATKLLRYAGTQNPVKVNSSFIYLSCYRAAEFDSFEYQIDTSLSFNSKILRTFILPDTFKYHYIESLEDDFLFGKTYYWRIRGIPEYTLPWTDTGAFQIFDSITPKYPTTAFLHNVKIDFEFTATNYKQAFQVQIDTSLNFNSPLLVDTVASEGTKQYDPEPFSIGNLHYETYYHYRVRAINGIDSSKWSYSAFTTKGFKKDFVNAENYADPITILQIRSEIDGSKGYEILLDTTRNFNSPELKRFNSKNGRDTAVDLFFGKIYYAKSRPYHERDSGDWSIIKSINILKYPNVYYPFPSSTVHLTDSLQFATRKGVDGFQIQVTSAQNFESALFLDTIIDEFNINQTHLIKGHRFKYNTVYQWRIRGWHSRDTSPWSDIRKFTTVKAPKQLLPFNSNFLGIGTSTNFTWEPIRGSISYEFVLDTTPNFNSPILIDSVFQGTETSISQLLFRPLYYWRVRAISPDDTSEWSETWVCKVLSVRLNTPRNNITNLTLYSLDWNSIVGTTGYILEVDTASDFSRPFRAQDTQTLSFFHYFHEYPDFIGFETKCYWRVKLFHETDTSEWSAVWNFTTKPRRAPILVSPTDSSVDERIFNQLKWQAYSGASSYAVQYGDKPDFSNAIKTTSTGTTLNVTLKPNTRYYWRVRGRNSDGNEFYDYSEEWTFTTDSGIPAPKLISPVNGAQNQALNVLFSWEKFTPSTNYRLEISKDKSFNSGVVTKNSATGFATFTHLEGGTTYHWRVKTINGSIESPWSNSWDFSTEKVNQIQNNVIDQISVSPNPSQGIFNISCPKAVFIHRIIDGQGKTLITFNTNTQLPNRLNLEHLPPGLYFVQIQTEMGVGVLRLVRE